MITKNYSKIILSFNLSHLEHLEKFLDELDLLWNQRLKEYEVRGNEFEDEETREEFFDFYFDDWSVYRDNYPNIAKYSVLVSSHSLLEKLCTDYYQRAAKNNTNWKVITKTNKHALDYIDCFRKNFGKQLLNTETYQMFREFNQVRNKIVHSNGKVDREKDIGIMQIIQKLELLSLNNHGEIILTTDYVKKILKMITDIITQIHNSVFKEE